VSPDLVALARDYMALPGAPNMADVLFAYSRGGTFYRRDENGMLWLDVAPLDALLGDWLPDLADAATGGVMLAALAPLGLTVSTYDGPHGYGMMLGGKYDTRCRTLGEALARVAVAVGRAG